MIDWSDHHNYNCEITLEDGRQFKVYANWLHNQELDQWQGWRCYAGAKRLYIDKDFTVYSGQCQNDILGSALTRFILLPETICKKSNCTGCADDLLVEKHRDQ